MKVKSTIREIPSAGIEKTRWHSNSSRGRFTLVGTEITLPKEALIKDARRGK